MFFARSDRFTDNVAQAIISIAYMLRFSYLTVLPFLLLQEPRGSTSLAKIVCAHVLEESKVSGMDLCLIPVFFSDGP